MSSGSTAPNEADLLSANYTDPRLAAAYDALNPEGPDTDFYVDLAGSRPRAILDIGCGTGLLTCRLAACGHTVTGADPAVAMLDVARRRPGGRCVDWLEADAASIRSGTMFDLVIMSGHAFQCLLSDRHVGAALDNIRALLKPGGQLAFETRNPVARAWTGWTPQASRYEVDVEGHGRLTVHHAVVSVVGEVVDFDTYYQFGHSEPIRVRSRLRFMSQASIRTVLADAGFAPSRWYGDWNGSLWRMDSPEIIVLADRDGSGCSSVT